MSDLRARLASAVEDVRFGRKFDGEAGEQNRLGDSFQQGVLDAITDAVFDCVSQGVEKVDTINDGARVSRVTLSFDTVDGRRATYGSALSEPGRSDAPLAGALEIVRGHCDLLESGEVRLTVYDVTPLAINYHHIITDQQKENTTP